MKQHMIIRPFDICRCKNIYKGILSLSQLGKFLPRFGLSLVTLGLIGASMYVNVCDAFANENDRIARTIKETKIEIKPATTSIAAVTNEWNDLAAQVELLEQKKKVAKLQSEIRNIEQADYQNKATQTFETWRPMVQTMIQDSLQKALQKTESSRDLPNKVSHEAAKLPLIHTILGRDVLRCDLRLADGSLQRVSAGQRIGNITISKITKDQVFVKYRGKTTLLDFE